MQFPQLQMESQMARIGITQTPTKMDIRQPKADVQMQQPKADLSIRTVKGKLTIDQSQAWEETNLKSARRWNEEFAAAGMQAAKEGTARRAEQGAELIDIHLDRNVIAEQAIENGHPAYRIPNVAYMPSPFAVKIHYERGDVQIDATTNKPIMDVQVRKPEIHAYRGKVNITMKQYAALKIDVKSV